ncbi:major histocompatibility complex class I-related gene protein-like [Spea bombifrons]|uniref:major histocompatibility complex class I-related gene protein-like n=1 Tax=Spea bombifrons TaxID=233779 RepID=UPI0023498B15|nr:major histocompatibility complex class I-related gene protein-like [Spea bombifrons]
MDSLGKFLTLLVALLRLPSAIYSESYSLNYYITMVSSPLPGLPLYSVIGYVDDVFFGKYTSDSRRARPALQWMAERVEPEHWQMLAQLGQYYENVHKIFMMQFRNLHNQTKGISVLQVKFACHKHEDGGIGGYLEFAFNGKEFVVFDKDNLIYIPGTHEAQVITEKWNNREFQGQRNKNLIEIECIGWMDKYVLHGKHYLLRKVPPQVKVTEKASGGVTKLLCHVYGFYPRDVDVKWMRNGADEVYSDEAKQILPNTDGTYQIRASVEVTPREGDSYSCNVDHSSLEKELIVPWEPTISTHRGIALAVGASLVLLCVLIVVFGVLAYRRFHDSRI